MKQIHEILERFSRRSPEAETVKRIQNRMERLGVGLSFMRSLEDELRQKGDGSTLFLVNILPQGPSTSGITVEYILRFGLQRRVSSTTGMGETMWESKGAMVVGDEDDGVRPYITVEPFEDDLVVRLGLQTRNPAAHKPVTRRSVRNGWEDVLEAQAYMDAENARFRIAQEFDEKWAQMSAAEILRFGMDNAKHRPDYRYGFGDTNFPRVKKDVKLLRIAI